MIILLLVILNILVVVHELGHYTMARLFGVRVLEFSVGFGPLLTKRVRRDTQYSLRAVPLGGFVKLAGMDMAIEGESPENRPDDPGSLRFQPAWKKALIIMAGPVFNLILAVLIFIVACVAVGMPSSVEKRAFIGFVEPKTPGYEAGLTAGDRVVSLDGRRIELWTDLAEGIRASQGKPITLKVIRSGRELTRTMTPFYDPATKGYRLGIAPKYYFKRLPLGQSIVTGTQFVYWSGVGLVQLLTDAVRGKARVPLSGPIGVVGALNQSVQAGPWWFLQLVVSINLFLALFNLLPIPLPLLDGGWVVIYLIEGIRRREFTADQKAAAQIFGLLILAAFFLFITYGDVLTGLRRFYNR